MEHPKKITELLSIYVSSRQNFFISKSLSIMKKLFFFITLFVSINKLIGQSGFYITSSDNTKLYAQESGSGEPIIFLAGGPGLNAVYLKPVWENLSSRYRCIVLDQRGTGKSEMTLIDSTTINVNNYVNDLESLRKYSKIEQLTLVGHSWGGILSMEYAARHPDQRPVGHSG